MIRKIALVLAATAAATMPSAVTSPAAAFIGFGISVGTPYYWSGLGYPLTWSGYHAARYYRPYYNSYFSPYAYTRAYSYAPAYTYGAPVLFPNYGLGGTVAWCRNRYRTYNVATGMYFGYDGRYHYCVVPY
jgi:hypothetical protein